MSDEYYYAKLEYHYVYREATGYFSTFDSSLNRDPVAPDLSYELTSVNPYNGVTYSFGYFGVALDIVRSDQIVDNYAPPPGEFYNNQIIRTNSTFIYQIAEVTEWYKGNIPDESMAGPLVPLGVHRGGTSTSIFHWGAPTIYDAFDGPELLAYTWDWSQQGEAADLDIVDLKLNDIDGSKLRYVSVDSDNKYKGGFTLINGSLKIKGDENDKLSSLELSISQGDKIATAELAKKGIVGKKFGEDGMIIKLSGDRLFTLSKLEASKLDVSDGKTPLKLIVRAQSASGEVAIEESPVDMTLLTRFDAGRRFTNRDKDQGGDDWVRPQVSEAIDYFETKGFHFGDASNMNGGPFAPHKAHEKGLSVDAFVSGYNRKVTKMKGGIEKNHATYEVTQAGIQKIIAAVDGSPYEDHLKAIYVDIGTKAVRATIDNAIEAGKISSSLFVHRADHDTHFHLEFVF